MDLLYLVVLIIPAIAQLYVTSTYNRYKQKRNGYGLTGFDVARRILDSNGLQGVYIVETPGNLTDHYDPARKTVRLSSDIYHGTSIASMAVAAHECGHAIQDKDGYLFLKLRSLIYPVVNLGTKFAYIIMILGFFFQVIDMLIISFAIVGLGLLFQVVTLPVEFDASNRAKRIIKDLNMSNSEDDDGVSSMLTSAALTYVAGVLSSAIQMLRLIMIFNDRRRR